MKPRSVLAAWIIRSQAKCFPWAGHFPGSLRVKWFEKSADVGPIVQKDPSPHSGAQWRRLGNPQIAPSNSTEVVIASRFPCSTIEITCDQVNFLTYHNGTKNKNKLLGDAVLLGVDVAKNVYATPFSTCARLLPEAEIWHVNEHLARPIPVLLP